MISKPQRGEKGSTKYRSFRICLNLNDNLFERNSVHCSVMSNSLWPPGQQLTRLLCPSPTPSLLNLMSIKSVMPSNHFILCLPLLLPPSIFPSIRVFSNEPVHHIRWPKYWRFSFSISPFNEYSRLLSLRIDAVQETLKSLLQHHSSKTSILQHLAFLIVQLSHLYMTTGKTIAVTRYTFVVKIMSLLLFLINQFIYFNWRIITLRYHDGFSHTLMCLCFLICHLGWS